MNDYFSSTVIPKNVYDDWERQDEAAQYGSFSSEKYWQYGVENYGYPFGLVVSGYDGSGYLLDDIGKYTVDWITLKDDLISNLAKKKVSISVEELNAVFGINDFTATVSKDDSISNGDYVTVTVSPRESVYYCQGKQIVFVQGQKSFLISGLDKGSDIDLFDYVKWTKNGPNGQGKISCKISDSFESTSVEGHSELTVEKFSNDTISIIDNGYIVAKVRFYVDEEESAHGYFSNGDTFDIVCYVEGADVLESKYGLVLRNISKTYTVTGLGEYITKDYEISADDLQFFVDKTKEMCEEWRESASINTLNISFEGSYLGDIKDKQYQGNEPPNKLCVVYKCIYTNWIYPSGKTYYYCAIYGNLCANDYGLYSYSIVRENSYQSLEEVLHYTYEDPYSKDEGYYYRQIN